MWQLKSTNNNKNKINKWIKLLIWVRDHKIFKLATSLLFVYMQIPVNPYFLSVFKKSIDQKSWNIKLWAPTEGVGVALVMAL